MNYQRRRGRGTATVEMVIWMPLLFFVLFGIVELSRLWLAVAQVTAAAREGARTGSQTATGTGNVFNDGPALTAVNNVLASAGLSATSVVVECPPGGGGACVPGSEVRATVTATFTTALPALLPALSAVTIQEVTRMRYE